MRKHIRQRPVTVHKTRLSRHNTTPAGAQISSSPAQQRPTSNDREAWKSYWGMSGQPWRWEPEIDQERQHYLSECLTIELDITQGRYPFTNVKLTRADIEWLLAQHKEHSQDKQKGLDLRGANLRRANLSHLPLTGLRAGIDWDDSIDAASTTQVVEAASAHFEGASLDWTQLEDACLDGAHFEGASLYEAYLQNATLSFAQLQGSDLSQAQLDKANLYGACLEQTYLRRACLTGATLAHAKMTGADLKFANMPEADLDDVEARGVNFCKANLKGAKFFRAHLGGADLSEAHLEDATCMYADMQNTNLTHAHLEGADLSCVHLEQSRLIGAQLQGAELIGVHLEKADLSSAHLEQTNLTAAFLQGANLYGVFFDSATVFRGVILSDKMHGAASLLDIRWGDVNLSNVNWASLKILGDEEKARHYKIGKERAKDKARRRGQYQSAARANRQLALVLQSQGINELATYYAYQAQRLQRMVYRYQRKFGQYLFSLFLDLIAGYGYKPARSVLAYLIVIFGFMGLYLLNAHFVTPHLRWDEALVLSISSFHGRGFFTQDITLGDAYARIAAAEAIMGLLIELSFIATFTQRYFGK
jgi:uncharacterized protein YjbI with pentapeptide repeats